MATRPRHHSLAPVWLLWAGLAAAQGVTVDHTGTAAALISSGAVAAAAAQRLVVRHASVGANISAGLDALQDDDPRYDRGLWDFPDRGNPGWQAKVDDLVDFAAANLDRYDVFTMKLCYIDTDADWIYYRDRMEALEAAYPTKVFLWWTMPITTDGSAERDAFNDSVRGHCQDHGKWLFDIADIESHDPAGSPLLDAGHERLDPDYSSDGGHLNEVGSRRVAAALWWLMARVAGWDGSTTDPLLDSDGDGVSDDHERADGTEPGNPASFLLRDLAVTALSGSMKLTVAAHDACTLAAVIPQVPAGFVPNGAALVIDIGGAVEAFALDAKGRGVTGASKTALKLKLAKATGAFGGGDVPVKASLKQGTWATAWAAAGIDSGQDARNAPAELAVGMRFNGYVYGATVPISYSVRAGAGGRFRN